MTLFINNPKVNNIDKNMSSSTNNNKNPKTSYQLLTNEKGSFAVKKSEENLQFKNSDSTLKQQ